MVKCTLKFSNIFVIQKTTNTHYLQNLNPEQAAAVETTEGPLLVLAGAGTGKTKVLTSRIAHIVALQKAAPEQILAVTFTNKAAKEMLHRLHGLIGGQARAVMLGTFHALSAKILREYADHLGLNRDFTIIDFEDQSKIAKEILKQHNIDEAPKLLLWHINRLKDQGITPGNMKKVDDALIGHNSVATLYTQYQKRLQEANACDFGDLLLYNVELLEKHPELASQLSNRFRYILVDEYQDTNYIQYKWLKLLTKEHNNICCVGDDDQSIYGWRGADVRNILRFAQNFTPATTIRLQQNYRSTPMILNAASHIIKHNKNRHDKMLWTDQDHGAPIKLNGFYDEKEESRYIAEEIENICRNRSYQEIAILVRAGYQTRAFEESLNYLHIPYRIIGGVKFFERAEIKDAIAYMRVLHNKNDNLALERIINAPKRGIGPSTMQQLHNYARLENCNMYTACEALVTNGVIKNKLPLQNMLTAFVQAEQNLQLQPLYQTIENLLTDTGYIGMYRAEKSDEAKDKLENLKELLRTMQDYQHLGEYLEQVSLLGDTDASNEDDKVSIMTMHAAKGLEFPTVFLPGWQEGTFPSQKTIDEGGAGAIEEERRLAYVAITRAKENLYISYSSNRRVYGYYQSSLPSRFVDELPKDVMKNNNRYNYDAAHYQPIKNTVYTNAVQAGNTIKPGRKVHHKKFGVGVVLNISDMFAEVSFADCGCKKVLIDYLSLI